MTTSACRRDRELAREISMSCEANYKKPFQQARRDVVFLQQPPTEHVDGNHPRPDRKFGTFLTLPRQKGVVALGAA
jgi:hypothetical protein